MLDLQLNEAQQRSECLHVLLSLEDTAGQTPFAC